MSGNRISKEQLDPNLTSEINMIPSKIACRLATTDNITLKYANTKVMTSDDGINWITHSAANNNQWRGICYGNGIFVAVGYTGTGNRVMTSPDGINWTIRNTPADNGWMSVCYGNGLFVAISMTGTGNRVMTSPDGITWTSRTSAADNTWNSVCYGNGLFVAVASGSTGTGNRVMTSPDGINWTIRTSAADNIWRSVCYGNGLFVAVASGGTGTGNRVMTSPDGINWTIRTSAADNQWYEVCYGNGLFVAVAFSGTGNRVMTSPDGINWTSRTSAADNGWLSVRYGNGLFVAVACDGTGNRIMTSIDGITWTSRTSVVDNYWTSIAFGNNKFVAISFNDGDKSIDGVNIAKGDRILVKNQTLPNQNGIYIVCDEDWVRAEDANTSEKVKSGINTFIQEGIINSGAKYTLTTKDPIILDTTALTFTKTNGLGQITVGEGLINNNDTLNINPDDNTIEISNNKVRIKEVNLNPTTLNFGFNKILNNNNFPLTTNLELKGLSYVNLLGKDGNCENVSKWSINGLSALDSANKVFGSNAIKLTINNVSPTHVYMSIADYASLISRISGKYLFVSAYIKNGNATSCRLMYNTDSTGAQAVQNNTTSYVRVGLKVNSSTITSLYAIGLDVTGIEGNYAYIDGIMINEISSTEYSSSSVDALLAKYPYVDSYGCTKNIMLENRRGNLIRNGNCEEGIGYWVPQTPYAVLSIETGRFKIVTNATPTITYQIVNVRPNTYYYISSNVTPGTANAHIVIKNIAEDTMIFTDNGTFNSGINTQIKVGIYTYATGTAYFDSTMLIEETHAPSSYIPCDHQVAVIEGMFTSDDTVKIENGQVSGLLNWKHKTLYGKDYAWVYNSDYTGYKQIYVPFVNAVYATDVFVKFDGKILTWDGASASSDKYAWNTAISGTLYLEIADTDSGWAEAVSPNDNEVKAFMNGWKAIWNNATRYIAWISIVDNTVPSVAVVCNASGTNAAGQSILNVTDGTKFSTGSFLYLRHDNGLAGCYSVASVNGNQITVDGTLIAAISSSNPIAKTDNYGALAQNTLTWCMNNVAPGYEGYQLHYKLSNPEPLTDVNVHVEGNLWNIEPGDNYIFVDTGIVLGEVANNKFDNTSTYNFGYDGMNNNGTYYSGFKFIAESNIAFYKNGINCNLDFTQLNYGNSYDNCYAAMPSSKYDINATYTVDYKILATIAPQAMTSLILTPSKNLFETISGLSSQIEQKQQKDSTLDNIIDLSLYEEFNFPSNIVNQERCSVNIAGNAFIIAIFTCTPKKTKNAKLTLVSPGLRYSNGSDAVNVINTTDVIFTASITDGKFVKIIATYAGTDTTIKSNLLNYGARLDCAKLIIDCKEVL